MSLFSCRSNLFFWKIFWSRRSGSNSSNFLLDRSRSKQLVQISSRSSSNNHNNNRRLFSNLANPNPSLRSNSLSSIQMLPSSSSHNSSLSRNHSLSSNSLTRSNSLSSSNHCHLERHLLVW